LTHGQTFNDATELINGVIIPHAGMSAIMEAM
jgi:hypothetical protein